MKISRFFGITNREAMRQVRLALGSEALIVSNRRVNGGVEILATDPTSVSEAEEGAGFATPVRGGEPAASPTPGSFREPPPSQTPAQTQRQAQPQSAAQPQPAVQGGRPPSSSAALGAYAAAFQAVYGTPENPQPQRRAQPQAGPAALPVQPQAHPASPPIQPQAHSATPPDASHSSAVLGLDAPAAGQPGVMDAIGAMRGALESRIDELLWGNQLRRAPQAASLFQTLLNFGFST